jgi:rfaE bifunctional protein kinase chain/domain
MSNFNFEILNAIREKRAGKKAVFVSGNFNVIHPGHLRLLNFARTCGDYLIVGLHDDHQESVIVPFSLRQESLNSLESVDEVIQINPSHISEFIKYFKPESIVKGKEYEGINNVEKEALKEYGGHLIFSSGEAKFSSLDLIRRELNNPSDFLFKNNKDYLLRHGTSISRLREVVDNFKNLNVMVIGDLIVDEYIYCDPLGMSQEDPTIVVTPIESKKFVGGAGIVAGHLASLGARTDFISIVGQDQSADFSQEVLSGWGVYSELLKDENRPTILKQRFRVQNKTLLRVSHLRSHDIEEEIIDIIVGKLELLIPKVDVFVFSDFNYGALPQKLVTKISEICIANNVPFIADSQASSQVGDISRYVGADLISATEREVRLAVNDFKSGLQNVTDRLLDKMKTSKIIVKLGAEGLLIASNQKIKPTDSLNAMNCNPVDVAGAGDALLSVSSLALASGATIWESAYLGSIAAAIQVSRTGNIPVGREALLNVLTD